MAAYFPKAVLCGSMRFINDIYRAAQKYTLRGYMVFAPFINDKDDTLADNTISELKEMHMRKIEESDLVVIVDFKYHMGFSTKQEYNYAKSLDKQIEFWNGNGD